jgi:MFS family permease
MTAASKYLPKEKLGIGLTLVSVGGPLGVAISAPVLMHLIINYGWRSTFISTGVVGFLWIIVWLWIAKEKAVTDTELVATKDSAQLSPIQTETKFTSVLFSVD